MESDRQTSSTENVFPAIGVLGLGFPIGTVTSLAFPFTVLLVVSALMFAWFVSWQLWFDPQKDSRPQYLMSSFTLGVIIQAGLWYPAELLLALRFVLYAGSSVLILIGIIYGIGTLGFSRMAKAAQTTSTPSRETVD